jgi:acetyl-CoA carboxylase biotin carboxyl carrier protein
MNLKELRELIEIVGSDPTIDEFEYVRTGVRIRIRRTLHTSDARREAQAPSSPHAESVTAGAAGSLAEASSQPEAEEAGRLTIASPMVGTFYRSPSPESEPFVKVGDTIEKGTVVCIIEAMKLMNEIESEYEGEVVKVYLESGQPVQYGERLFAIRTS